MLNSSKIIVYPDIYDALSAIIAKKKIRVRFERLNITHMNKNITNRHNSAKKSREPLVKALI